jgi:hypothetical protein
MNTYNQETIFHLPGLFGRWDLCKQILENYYDNPQFFKDNVKIGSFYDCPSAVWNGGRLMTGLPFRKSDLIKIKDFLLKYNTPARFTFTNCLLKEEHLYDTYGNMLLDIFNTGTNEVICNTEILENYIRNKYGDRYKYISSTTKRLSSVDNQNEELKKDYYLVVLDYDHNKNFDYLQSISNKDKCELLCNAVCQGHCARRKRHYEIISQCQLDFDETALAKFDCPYAQEDNLEGAKKNSNFISIQDINNIYLPMGFKNFKIEGRTMHPLDLIEVILYYLIKEEYHDSIRRYLQRTYF